VERDWRSAKAWLYHAIGEKRTHDALVLAAKRRLKPGQGLGFQLRMTVMGEAHLQVVAFISASRLS
jgi:hypothetical protein